MGFTFCPSARDLARAAGVRLPPGRDQTKTYTSPDGRVWADEEPAYGMVGNGETVALIGRDFSISWLPLPTLGGHPFFCHAFRPEEGARLTLHGGTTPACATNGAHRIAPADGAVAEQSYFGRTNILVTSVTRDGWRLRVIDSMPWGQPFLVRRVTMTNEGAPAQPFYIAFGFEPTALLRSEYRLVQQGGPDDGMMTTVTRGDDEAITIGWIGGAVPVSTAPWPRIDGNGARIAGVVMLGPPLRTGESRNAILLIAYGRRAPRAEHRWLEAARRLRRQLPGDPAGLMDERAFWASWLADKPAPAGARPGEDEAYYRSLLTQKMLAYPASEADSP